MLERYQSQNRFVISLKAFTNEDPHLLALQQLQYQYQFDWWHNLDFSTPGVYILTGGRQVGKSTSCKLIIQHCLKEKLFGKSSIFYLPCDEIYDAHSLSQTLRSFLDQQDKTFLLIIDEITYVKDWDRVIKSLADEGYFRKGLCLLTGSDTVILKEAAMRFPGRRGSADQTDFHLYPLSFREYVNLVSKKKKVAGQLQTLFLDYLKCGGYLPAINAIGKNNTISNATFLIYEQWIRGDFIKRGKSEGVLVDVITALLKTGVSQISYSKLTQKIGTVSKDTVIEYCNLLERMDVLLILQAFDQNNKRGFPRKDRKFHFIDPFIHHTLNNWCHREGLISDQELENTLVEAIVASNCNRFGKTFYFKGQGEVDVIQLINNKVVAIEVKWANQVRPNDLRMLKQFPNAKILTKQNISGNAEHIQSLPVYQFLFDLQ